MYGNSNKTYGKTCTFQTIHPEESAFYGGALRVYAYEKRKDEDLGKHRFIFAKQRNQGNKWHTYTNSYSQEDVEVSYCNCFNYGPTINSIKVLYC